MLDARGMETIWVVCRCIATTEGEYAPQGLICPFPVARNPVTSGSKTPKGYKVAEP